MGILEYTTTIVRKHGIGHLLHYVRCLVIVDRFAFVWMRFCFLLGVGGHVYRRERLIEEFLCSGGILV